MTRRARPWWSSPGLWVLLLLACPAPDPEADAGASADAGEVALDESEPNDGATLDAYDALPLDARMRGALQQADDTDIFRFDATPGALVVVTLTPDDGSALQPHLTVMDAGDSSAPAGDDYVKILRGADGVLVIELLAMGRGAYFAVVRDARNVGGAGGAGGPDHGYTLVVTARDAGTATRGPLNFSTAETGALAHAGAVALYSFEGTAWTDLRVDLRASGDLDGRLFVFSLEQQDWIARNDNRAQDDLDPLIDAPLTAGGPMLLLVENIAEQASSLGYTLSAARP